MTIRPARRLLAALLPLHLTARALAAVAQVATDLSDSSTSYPLACTPNPVKRAQEISCVVDASGWEVVGWEFVSDRVAGSDDVIFVREDCPIRVWAGPVIMSGRVRVHLSRDTVRRSFQTHFTVTDRPSPWPGSWTARAHSAAPAPPPEDPCTPYIAHERRRVWRTPARLLGDLVRAYEVETPPPTAGSDLSAIMLGLATYTGGTVEVVLDGLEQLALGSGPVAARIQATYLIGTSGSRDALEPRQDALARLQRIYRGSAEWQVQAAVINSLARSADHGETVAFLAEIATSPSSVFSDAPMFALSAIASHADSGVPTLRRLQKSGAVRHPEGRSWLALISKTGYRVR